MAKGALMGVQRGKLGNMVLYRVSASNSKEKQGARIYVAQPSNPKTEGQAAQRAYMKPIAAFYQSNSDLLNHSFIPRGTKAQNYQRFLKLALTNAADHVPAIPAGDIMNAPGYYQLSEGNLASVNLTLGATGVTTTSLAVGNLTIDAATTFGDISAAIEGNNAGFVDGDELLFIACFQLTDGSFIYVKRYIVLDTANTTPVSAWSIGGSTFYGFSYVAFSVVNGMLAFQVIESLAEIGSADGVAVCHSRKTADSWDYSNAFMTISSAAATQYFGAGARQTATKSYMPRESSRTSDKLLQQSDMNSGLQISQLVKLAFQGNERDSRFFGRWAIALGARLSDGSYALFADMNLPEQVTSAGDAYGSTRINAALNGQGSVLKYQSDDTDTDAGVAYTTRYFANVNGVSQARIVNEGDFGTFNDTPAGVGEQVSVVVTQYVATYGTL